MGKVFQFKEFSIRHDHSMSVGTDGVLLGAWTRVGSAKRILDIGTGSGLVALMMAQRSSGDARIDAVEPDPASCEEAGRNVDASRWAAKVNLHCMQIQDFPGPPGFDLIVSNPPFFGNDLLPPHPSRARTRHTVTLGHRDLLLAVERLLADDGRFNMILPARESPRFIALAGSHHLHQRRAWSLRTRAGKPVRRLLMEFGRSAPRQVEAGEILLYQTGNEWTSEYRALTGEFYLSR